MKKNKTQHIVVSNRTLRELKKIKREAYFHNLEEVIRFLLMKKEGGAN